MNFNFWSMVTKKDYGDDGIEYSIWGVGVAPGGGITGYVCAMANKGLYTADAGHCSGAGGLTAHI